MRLKIARFGGVNLSFDVLIDKIAQCQNPTVVGLDPKLDFIPESILAEYRARESFEGAADAIYAFNRGLIDALCDVVPTVKPQSAYYELYGWQGMRALRQTIDYAKAKGLYVIIDGKRNDIGPTAEAYATAWLGETEHLGAAFGADALTVNGYLGADGLLPFVAACRANDKGIFVLCKTSNPSSGELQDKIIGDESVYELLGNMCEELGDGTAGQHGYSVVGAVVGATYPQQLTELRKKLPHTFFLVPGYGTQGGTASALAGAFDANGRGAIVNSSRAVLCAWKKEGCAPEEYAEAARREALRMRDEINMTIVHR